MIAGYCFSGLVAFEAARQLEAIGRRRSSSESSTPTMRGVGATRGGAAEVRRLRAARPEGKGRLDQTPSEGSGSRPDASPLELADTMKGSGVTIEGIMTLQKRPFARGWPTTRILHPCTRRSIRVRRGRTRLDAPSRFLARARRGGPRHPRARSRRDQTRQLDGRTRTRATSRRRRRAIDDALRDGPSRQSNVVLEEVG